METLNKLGVGGEVVCPYSPPPPPPSQNQLLEKYKKPELSKGEVGESTT